MYSAAVRDTSVALAAQRLPPLPLNDGISMWNAERLEGLLRQVRAGRVSSEERTFQESLFQTIDILGARSKIAQGINSPLTSVAKLRENREFRLYLLVEGHLGMGILKVGTKKLFVTHPMKRHLVEVMPLCVLDFYVSEQVQRSGFGRRLYMAMLHEEGLTPAQLAIDRPSEKLLSFMKRHFGLQSYTAQTNNFVVYHEFFDNTIVNERGQVHRAVPVYCVSNETTNSQYGNGAGGGSGGGPSRPNFCYPPASSSTAAYGNAGGGGYAVTPPPPPPQAPSNMIELNAPPCPSAGYQGCPPTPALHPSSQGRNFLADRTRCYQNPCDPYSKNGNPGDAFSCCDCCAPPQAPMSTACCDPCCVPAATAAPPPPLLALPPIPSYEVSKGVSAEGCEGDCCCREGDRRVACGRECCGGGNAGDMIITPGVECCNNPCCVGVPADPCATPPPLVMGEGCRPCRCHCTTQEDCCCGTAASCCGGHPPGIAKIVPPLRELQEGIAMTARQIEDQKRRREALENEWRRYNCLREAALQGQIQDLPHYLQRKYRDQLCQQQQDAFLLRQEQLYQQFHEHEQLLQQQQQLLEEENLRLIEAEMEKQQMLCEEEFCRRVKEQEELLKQQQEEIRKQNELLLQANHERLLKLQQPPCADLCECAPCCAPCCQPDDCHCEGPVRCDPICLPCLTNCGGLPAACCDGCRPCPAPTDRGCCDGGGPCCGGVPSTACCDSCAAQACSTPAPCSSTVLCAGGGPPRCGEREYCYPGNGGGGGGGCCVPSSQPCGGAGGCCVPSSPQPCDGDACCCVPSSPQPTPGYRPCHPPPPPPPCCFRPDRGSEGRTTSSDYGGGRPQCHVFPPLPPIPSDSDCCCPGGGGHPPPQGCYSVCLGTAGLPRCGNGDGGDLHGCGGGGAPPCGPLLLPPLPPARNPEGTTACCRECEEASLPEPPPPRPLLIHPTPPPLPSPRDAHSWRTPSAGMYRPSPGPGEGLTTSSAYGSGIAVRAPPTPPSSLWRYEKEPDYPGATFDTPPPPMYVMHPPPCCLEPCPPSCAVQEREREEAAEMERYKDDRGDGWPCVAGERGCPCGPPPPSGPLPGLPSRIPVFHPSCTPPPLPSNPCHGRELQGVQPPSLGTGLGSLPPTGHVPHPPVYGCEGSGRWFPHPRGAYKRWDDEEDYPMPPKPADCGCAQRDGGPGPPPPPAPPPAPSYRNAIPHVGLLCPHNNEDRTYAYPLYRPMEQPDYPKEKGQLYVAADGTVERAGVTGGDPGAVSSGSLLPRRPPPFTNVLLGDEVGRQYAMPKPRGNAMLPSRDEQLDLAERQAAEQEARWQALQPPSPAPSAVSIAAYPHNSASEMLRVNPDATKGSTTLRAPPPGGAYWPYGVRNYPLVSPYYHPPAENHTLPVDLQGALRGRLGLRDPSAGVEGLPSDPSGGGGMAYVPVGGVGDNTNCCCPPGGGGTGLGLPPLPPIGRALPPYAFSNPVFHTPPLRYSDLLREEQEGGKGVLGVTRDTPADYQRAARNMAYPAFAPSFPSAGAGILDGRGKWATGDRCCPPGGVEPSPLTESVGNRNYAVHPLTPQGLRGASETRLRLWSDYLSKTPPVTVPFPQRHGILQYRPCEHRYPGYVDSVLSPELPLLSLPPFPPPARPFKADTQPALVGPPCVCDTPSATLIVPENSSGPAGLCPGVAFPHHVCLQPSGAHYPDPPLLVPNPVTLAGMHPHAPRVSPVNLSSVNYNILNGVLS